MESLKISATWQETHPGATAGLLIMEQIRQPKNSPELSLEKTRVEEKLRELYPDKASLKGLATAGAYKRYYKQFGWNYTVLNQVVSVAQKGREIPDFLPLVTAMFTAELDTMVLTAGHDLAKLKGPIRLEVASGEESYVKMGGKPQQVKKNDIYMADDQGVIAAILHGPDERTKITENTTGAAFCIYGVPGLSRQAIREHMTRLETLVRLIHAGAQTRLKEAYPAKDRAPA